MKINKERLAIKGHYFLRYAGTAYMTMLLPLIVRSKGLSAQTVGLLWSVLPVVGLITNSISGTMADYFRAHRIVFLASLVSLTTGTVSIYWIPKIPFVAETSKQAFSLAPVENVTLHSSVLIANSSSLLLANVDPDMTVGEGQAASLLLPPNQEAMADPVKSIGLASLVDYPQFWFIFFALMVEKMGLSTCVMISDAICFQILGSQRHMYGRQRLWGTIGMGLMAIVSGALVDVYSQGLPEKDFLPAIISCIIFMSADLVLVTRMKIPYSNDYKLKIGEVGNTLVHPQVLLFLMTVYVMGASLGIVWVFKLMLVEDVALTWNPEFPALKLLQGLVLGIETFLGEVPFFFLSGMIIERLGYTRVLVTSLLSLGLRCWLYYTVSNPWCFLPIEILNGLSYSLFHSAMASYASHIAPPGAQATLQSVVRATFSTGLSTAGFLGGILYNSWGGSIAFLQVGGFDVVYVLVFLLLHFLINKCCTYDKVPGEAGCTTLQDTAKMDAFADEAPEVVKKLFFETKCAEGARSEAAAHENTECARFIV